MRTINLLPQQTADSVQLLAIKSKIYMFSTLVVGAMVLLLAAFAGWWFYLSHQQGVTTQEIATLQGQISGLATQEVLARQISDRAGAIQAIFASRVDVGQDARKLVPTNGVTIVKWTYDSVLKKSVVQVAAAQPELIEQYLAELGKLYPQLTLIQFDFTSDTGWLATASL
jgi:hypothetical protein